MKPKSVLLILAFALVLLLASLAFLIAILFNPVSEKINFANETNQLDVTEFIEQAIVSNYLVRIEILSGGPMNLNLTLCNGSIYTEVIEKSHVVFVGADDRTNPTYRLFANGCNGTDFGYHGIISSESSIPGSIFISLVSDFDECIAVFRTLFGLNIISVVTFLLIFVGVYCWSDFEKSEEIVKTDDLELIFVDKNFD